MAKPEWGQKRTCPSCGSRFYDLMRDPITCPSCSATIDPLAFAKTRRSRPAAAKPVAETVLVGADETEIEEPEKIDAMADDEENDKDIIEDASELGEDEDDVSEVVEGVEGVEDDDDR